MTPRNIVRHCFLAIALSSTPSWAEDSSLTSTYTKIDACQAVDEQEDAFMLKCRGPHGAVAMLQYVEGRVGLIFLPGMKDKQLSESDLIAISPNAGKAFSGQMEWVSASPNMSPCANILRIPTRQGSRLVVTRLSDGTRTAIVKGNVEARATAQKACGEEQASNSSNSLTENATADADLEKQVEAGISAGAERYGPKYSQEGMAGVEAAVADCYKQLTSAPTVAKLAECASMDFMAEGQDAVFASSHNMPKVGFFAGHKPLKRMKSAAAADLKLSPKTLDYLQRKLTQP